MAIQIVKLPKRMRIKEAYGYNAENLIGKTIKEISYDDKSIFTTTLVVLEEAEDDTETGNAAA